MSSLAVDAAVTVVLIVEDDQRDSFEDFAREHVYELAQESLDYEGHDVNATDLPIPDTIEYLKKPKPSSNSEPDSNATPQKPESIPEPIGSGPFAINWQQYPFSPNPPVLVMTNLMRLPTTASAIVAVNATMKPKLSFVRGRTVPLESQLIQPIFEDIYNPYEDSSNQRVVGFVWLMMDWSLYFSNLLPENVKGVNLVVKSSCGQVITYVINGLEAEFVDFDDVHDPQYDYLEFAADFQVSDVPVDTDNPMICIDRLSLHLYPSKDLEDASRTSKPVVYSVFVAAVFFFTSFAFITYDCAVRRHRTKVMERVITQDKIVSNLFPASIRDQLYGLSLPDEDEMVPASSKGSSTDPMNPFIGTNQLQTCFWTPPSFLPTLQVSQHGVALGNHLKYSFSLKTYTVHSMH